uniref:Transmembrane protein 14C n=1 Tax=Apteryx owenii TaxID=8824 RepID=A0A8B9S7Z0_APTOW
MDWVEISTVPKELCCLPEAAYKTSLILKSVLDCRHRGLLCARASPTRASGAGELPALKCGDPRACAPEARGCGAHPALPPRLLFFFFSPSRAAGKGKLWAVRCALASLSAPCSAPGCSGAERGWRAGERRPGAQPAGALGLSPAALSVAFPANRLAALGLGLGTPRGSVPSLAAGLLFGSFAGLGAYQLSQDPNNVWISLITSGTLTAVMGTRFYNSGKFMPAGLIAGVSLLMVGRLALKMMEKPHDKSNKCTQEEKVFGRRIREVALKFMEKEKTEAISIPQGFSGEETVAGLV